MRNLGAVEATNEIRHDVFNMPGIDPAEQHQIRFMQSVCSQLGLDHTPENMHKVATALHRHDIGIHAGQEFPKYAVRDHDGAQKIVHDEQEERRWIEEPPPEPVKPRGPVIQDIPPHQENLDLTKQVPQPPEEPDHPAGRTPSAVTNREAAQDAHARQLVEEPNDDEVHFEEIAATGSGAEGGKPYAHPADVGVMAHDDADRDGSAGQDVNPTHDSVLGTETPQRKSGDSSAGTTDTGRRPVGNRRPM